MTRGTTTSPRRRGQSLRCGGASGRGSANPMSSASAMTFRAASISGVNGTSATGAGAAAARARPLLPSAGVSVVAWMVEVVDGSTSEDQSTSSSPSGANSSYSCGSGSGRLATRLAMPTDSLSAGWASTGSSGIRRRLPAAGSFASGSPAAAALRRKNSSTSSASSSATSGSSSLRRFQGSRRPRPERALSTPRSSSGVGPSSVTELIGVDRIWTKGLLVTVATRGTSGGTAREYRSPRG